MRFIVGKSVRPMVIEQSAGTSGLFTNEHRWVLEEVEDGTRVTQMESFFWDSRALLRPLVG